MNGLWQYGLANLHPATNCQPSSPTNKNIINLAMTTLKNLWSKHSLRSWEGDYPTTVNLFTRNVYFRKSYLLSINYGWPTSATLSVHQWCQVHVVSVQVLLSELLADKSMGIRSCPHCTYYVQNPEGIRMEFWGQTNA